jgi:CubicO group peptidase (beta-lactamase class C family)
VTGMSVGTYLRTEIAGPLDADFYLGLPASQEPRVARLVSFMEGLKSGPPASLAAARKGEHGGGPDISELAELAKTYFAPDGPLFKAMSAPGGALTEQEVWDSPQLHAAEIPAANGICDARSLARLYGACVDEVKTASGATFRIMSSEQVKRAVRQETEGPDKVLLGLDIQWGLGFNVNSGIIGLAGLGGPNAFGHFGMGGSAGWADADMRLGMGYVMNRMEIGTTGDTRSFGLMRSCIDAARSVA